MTPQETSPETSQATRQSVRLPGRRSPVLVPLLAVVLLGTAVLMAGSFLLKSQCFDNYVRDRDRLLCSNDIQVLYSDRGLVDRVLPYENGGLVNGQLPRGTVEYPVLTGLTAYAVSLVTTTDAGFLTVTALVLAPFGLLSAILLARLARWRALLFAFSPALLWYSFHNWDLLVVAATVGGLYAFSRARPELAAALFAVGGALKLWPIFLLAPLVLAVLRSGKRALAGWTALAGVATYVFVNLPFLLTDPQGWYAPYAFQQLRAADVTSQSIWFYAFPQVTTPQLNRLIPVLWAFGFIAAMTYGWLRSSRRVGYPFVQVCGATLCVFLLFNKAYSPQFALWLLPFFVLIRVRLGWWVAYTVFDTLVYVGFLRWLAGLPLGIDFGLAKQALILGIWGRAVMLVLLSVVFLRTAVVAEPEPLPVAAPVREPVPA